MKKTLSVKKSLSVLAIAALAFSLAACSSSTSADGCTPTASGSNSSKVKVTGKFGSAPTVKFTKGLSTTKTERSVVIDGKGAVAKANGTVEVDYTAYDAASGKKIDATTYKKGSTTSFQLKDTSILPGMIKGLQCSPAGSRVVAVIPPADAFKAAGSAGLGVKGTDSLVFVFDVVTVAAPVKVLPKANGAVQKPVAGLPTVKLASNGEPTITVPKADAPTDLKIADLKKGTGTTVKSGDTVTVHYTGVIWATGKVFDSSWTRGTPASFATTGVIPGFGKALVGQKVGSQVIAVIPPADGYGTGGQSAAGISGTDTLVFVVDILATS
ncbi:FKBP-type peptidyl-prolyl cis-trans isomerase [Frigoribacterium sp. UYMn621]|uniref:FKBP-type peptidyl-prolyl cis-trans isomerase n=1 Tax=Frigoribacterium sp. UYMn621 TaxID=3156343 RepID=UPI003390A155